MDLDEKTVDPALWGKNFPRRVRLLPAHRREVPAPSTAAAGSEALPLSKLEEDPRLKVIFDGYAFAIDFPCAAATPTCSTTSAPPSASPSGPRPGACLHCHASNTVAYREAGLKGGAPGTLDEAVRQPQRPGPSSWRASRPIGKMPYKDATSLVKHPVACIDCHDPKTMQLRVTKPGFLRGIVALAQSSEPVPHLPSIEKWRKGDRRPPYDANRDASRQEMRSMVCGQCHVEYYCGPKTTLFFPWNNGLKVEQIEATYDDYKFPDGHRFFDWKHARTGAEVLKAQHPEFELWSQGIHARSGVSCADCHMPYMREGAIKISDHHVRSPLLNIARSCQTCHRFPEDGAEGPGGGHPGPHLRPA